MRPICEKKYTVLCLETEGVHVRVHVCHRLTPFHYPLNAGAVSMATLTSGSQCYFFFTQVGSL